MHGAGDLTYDSAIAGRAQEWADNLCTLNPADGDGAINLMHSPADDYGENLAFFRSGAGTEKTIEMNTTTADSTERWYNEVNDPGYNYDMPGFNQNVGTGHFTQIVWKASERIGCGSCEAFVVCQYEPQGNILG